VGTTIIATAIGTLIGAIVGGFIVGLVSRSKERQIERLVSRVDTLETERIAKIERRLDEREHNCVGAEVQTSLHNLEGWMKKVSNKLDNIGDETAQQRAQIQAADKYVENVDKSLQRHKEVHHG